MPPRGSPSTILSPLPPPFLLPRSLLKPKTRATTEVTGRRNFGIKSLDRPKHDRFTPKELLSTPSSAYGRLIRSDTLPMRTGALATKKGMSALYDPATGVRTPCTVLQLDRVQVLAHKTMKKHGYYAVQVGCGWRHPDNVTKPMLGHFSKCESPPKRHVVEFRVRGRGGLIPIGTELKADHFFEGQFVDTRSNCKGKGFQGVMKRWGMHGQDRSHGASLSHRSLGSAGQGQGGGSRVYPGKKMAGNMGGQRNTVQNLKVLQVDSEKGIVVVKGKSRPGIPRFLQSHLCRGNADILCRCREWSKGLPCQITRCIEKAMACDTRIASFNI